MSGVKRTIDRDGIQQERRQTYRRMRDYIAVALLWIRLLSVIDRRSVADVTRLREESMIPGGDKSVRSVREPSMNEFLSKTS